MTIPIRNNPNPSTTPNPSIPTLPEKLEVRVRNPSLLSYDFYSTFNLWFDTITESGILKELHDLCRFKRMTRLATLDYILRNISNAGLHPRSKTPDLLTTTETTITIPYRRTERQTTIPVQKEKTKDSRNTETKPRERLTNPRYYS